MFSTLTQKGEVLKIIALLNVLLNVMTHQQNLGVTSYIKSCIILSNVTVNR